LQRFTYHFVVAVWSVKQAESPRMINVFGYVLEVLAVLMFIGAFRDARRWDFFEKHGVLTAKGNRDVVIIRAAAVAIRVFLGAVFLLLGLWMVGAFH
jgi:hypothetical protein